MSALDLTPAQARVRLRQLLAELSYQERDVVLASGKRSTFYIDCKQTMLTAEGHFLVGLLVHELVTRECPDARAIGGLTMGADPIASAVATYSFAVGKPLDAFYVRKEPKGHGTQAWIEGDKRVVPGTKVVIVEDVCTTGGSSLKAVERARIHELDVLRVVSLVDRQEGGREAVEAIVPFSSLFTRGDFQ